MIFGESKFGLRLLSGLAGAVTVLSSAKIAEVLGGGKLARSLASLSICFAAAFPAMSSFFSMNPVDIALCTVFIYGLARTTAAPSPQKWIVLGVLLGVGLLNKYTFLVLGFSVLVSFIITKKWTVLKSSWFYGCGVIGFVIFLPHMVWQIQNGWPTLEFMHNAAEFKNLSLSPFAFLLQLIFGLNPFTLPLWLSGLLYLLIRRETREFRFLGWMALVFLLIYIVQNSKTYYVFPIFPLLLGAGSAAVERFSEQVPRPLARKSHRIGDGRFRDGAHASGDPDPPGAAICFVCQGSRDVEYDQNGKRGRGCHAHSFCLPDGVGRAGGLGVGVVRCASGK